MDMLVHWGVFRNLRHEVGARASVLLAALAADAVILVAFATMKLRTDPMTVLYAVVGIAFVFMAQWIFLSRQEDNSEQDGKPVANAPARKGRHDH